MQFQFIMIMTAYCKYADHPTTNELTRQLFNVVSAVTLL